MNKCKTIPAIVVFLTFILSSCSVPTLKLFYDRAADAKEKSVPIYAEPYAEPKRVVTASSVGELMSYVKEGNVTILLEDGVYNLGNVIMISRDNVTIRGKSGNRDAVVIKGNGMTGSVPHGFLVRGDYFSVKDLTISDVVYHGIQIQGEKDADHLYVKNVVFRDIRQQMIKGSYDSACPETNSDYGIIEDSLFEYSAGQGHYWYCGGIDIHKGNHWIIRGNTFKNIISPESRLAEGAIHFWSNSRNTLIENNTIINCGRGIMLGLDSSSQFGGTIRNNFIHVVRDVGIYLCNAENVDVYNNTVFNDNSWNGSTYFNSIEYRFATTKGVKIKNNLTNRAISSRNGAAAAVCNNVTNARASWFKDAAAGDLHLASPVYGVVSAGDNLPGVLYDIDGQKRYFPCDIGADEL